MPPATDPHLPTSNHSRFSQSGTRVDWVGIGWTGAMEGWISGLMGWQDGISGGGFTR
jgi:hypothetical protein